MRDGRSFLLTGVYGFNDEIDRQSLWRELSDLQIDNTPWAIAGDFNAVRTGSERLGNSPSQSSMDDFNNMLLITGLIEFHYKGLFYTWDNRQLGEGLVMSKIDRCFSNEAFLNLFPNLWVEISSTIISDHKIILLHFGDYSSRPRAPFRHVDV